MTEQNTPDEEQTTTPEEAPEPTTEPTTSEPPTEEPTPAQDPGDEDPDAAAGDEVDDPRTGGLASSDDWRSEGAPVEENLPDTDEAPGEEPSPS